MPVSVKIPTQLREATGGESTAAVDGGTVGEVLDALYERYGELRSRIAEDGGLRRFVNVYVDGEDIRFLRRPRHAGRATATRSRSCPRSPAAERPAAGARQARTRRLGRGGLSAATRRARRPRAGYVTPVACTGQ